MTDRFIVNWLGSLVCTALGFWLGWRSWKRALL